MELINLLGPSFPQKRIVGGFGISNFFFNNLLKHLLEQTMSVSLNCTDIGNCFLMLPRNSLHSANAQVLWMLFVHA